MGLNLQVLGLFDGTIDEYHVRRTATEKAYKIGKRVKARVLYSYDTSPPRFALALTDHLVRLQPRITKDVTNTESKEMVEAYPIGTILESVKVVRVEPDRSVIVDVESGLQGFIHVRIVTF